MRGKKKLVCWLEKPCRVCGVVKSIHDFKRHSDRPDGHDSRCRQCRNEAQRRRLAEDAGYRDAVNAKQRQWRADNPDTVRRHDATRLTRRKLNPGEKARRQAERRRAAERQGKSYRTRAEIQAEISRKRALKAPPRKRDPSPYGSTPEGQRRKAKDYYTAKRDEVLSRKRRGRDSLADWYIAKLLLDGLEARFSSKIIPKPLIEAKRVQVQIKRLIKERLK